MTSDMTYDEKELAALLEEPFVKGSEHVLSSSMQGAESCASR